MAKPDPGKAYRDGLSVMEIADMFPDEAVATEWFEGLAGRQTVPALLPQEHARSVQDFRSCLLMLRLPEGVLGAVRNRP